MKNKEIYSLYITLNNLPSIKLPAKTSFSIVRNLKTLEPIVKDIEQTRLSILQEYGEEKEGVFHFPEDKIEEVTKELESLAEVDVDVSLVKISVSDLEQLNLSVEEATNLFLMIEEKG